MVRLPIAGLLVALLACSDSGPDAPVPLSGSYSGSNSTYAEIRLVLAEAEGFITGTLILQDGSGEAVFNGPVNGARAGSDGFEVSGGRAPSVGGGTVTVVGTRVGTGLQITLSSTWLPSTNLTLTQQS
jgi:hypothetical protein